MTDIRKLNVLDELDRLSEKATARPWIFRNGYCYQVNEEWNDALWRANPVHADAAFIAALVNSYSEISKKLRAAEAVCESVFVLKANGGDFKGYYSDLFLLSGALDNYRRIFMEASDANR